MRKARTQVFSLELGNTLFLPRILICSTPVDEQQMLKLGLLLMLDQAFYGCNQACIGQQCVQYC